MSLPRDQRAKKPAKPKQDRKQSGHPSSLTESGTGGDHHPAGHESQAQTNNAPPKSRRLWLAHEDPVVRLTGWVATFTCLLALVTGTQLLAFIQSERSALTATDFRFIGPIAAGKPLVLAFTLKNSGHATADITDMSVNWDNSLPDQLPLRTLSRLNTGPVPGSDQQLEVFNPSTPAGAPLILSASEVQMLTQGVVQFFVYGSVWYSDGMSLGIPQNSKFCFRYLSDLGTFGGCPIGWGNRVGQPDQYHKGSASNPSVMLR